MLCGSTDDVLAEAPSIVAIVDRFWAQGAGVHDAAFGFGFLLRRLLTCGTAQRNGQTTDGCDDGATREPG